MVADTVFDRDRRIRSARLTMAQTFYLVTLNQFVGKNPDAWPSQTTLAAAMNATRRGVQKWQTELEQLGVIQVDVGRGRNSTNRYRIDLSALPLNEEPRSALNDEHSAPLNAKNDPQMAHTVRLNGAHSAPLVANHVRTERTIERTKKEQGARTSTKRFRKPTAEQVAAYANSRGCSVFDADRFIDHHEANGWKVGCNAMKDWRATVRNWIRNGGTGGKQSVAPESQHVWQALLDSLKQHSRFNESDIENDIGPDAFAAGKAVGLKKIDEASEYDRRELKTQFFDRLNGKRKR